MSNSFNATPLTLAWLFALEAELSPPRDDQRCHRRHASNQDGSQECGGIISLIWSVKAARFEPKPVRRPLNVKKTAPHRPLALGGEVGVLCERDGLDSRE